MTAATGNYYELLEIEPTASSAEIRKAYFRLAKIYHPDRQVTQDEDRTEKFLAVQEAYDVLSDAKRRLEYDESHAAGSKPASDASDDAAVGAGAVTERASQNAEGTRSRSSSRRGPTLEEEKDARIGFMKAESLLEEGNHEQAARVMRAVVRTVPENPEYLSLAGYLQALEGGDRLHAARDLCQKAVEAQPFNALFLARLGFVYEEVGLRSRADYYYQKSLSKNPKQRLAASRVRGSSAKPTPGLLGAVKRLFGR